MNFLEFLEFFFASKKKSVDRNDSSRDMLSMRREYRTAKKKNIFE